MCVLSVYVHMYVYVYVYVYVYGYVYVYVHVNVYVYLYVYVYVYMYRDKLSKSKVVAHPLLISLWERVSSVHCARKDTKVSFNEFL